MAMPANMILVMYVILCILSYDFNKFTMLYIDVHISLISLTNKSGLNFFLSIKYLSVCVCGYCRCVSVSHCLPSKVRYLEKNVIAYCRSRTFRVYKFSRISDFVTFHEA